MRLKIYTNGKPEETRITNAETDEVLEGVIHTEVIIEPFNVTAVVLLNNFIADIEVDEQNLSIGSGISTGN